MKKKKEKKEKRTHLVLTTAGGYWYTMLQRYGYGSRQNKMTSSNVKKFNKEGYNENSEEKRNKGFVILSDCTPLSPTPATTSFHAYAAHNVISSVHILMILYCKKNPLKSIPLLLVQCSITQRIHCLIMYVMWKI